MAPSFYKNRIFKPTTRYYKSLIYNTSIYKSNKLKITSKEDILKFIITILDINLRFSSRFKDDSYLRNLIKKKLKSKLELNLLLRLRIQLFKRLAKRNIALTIAIQGK
jgi:hypothetical protein